MDTLKTDNIVSWGTDGPWAMPVSGLSPASAFRRMASHAHCLFLDSAMKHTALGRFSFLMADPVKWFQSDEANSRDWMSLCESVESFDLRWNESKDFPFIGGLAGLVNYDWGRSLEEVAAPRRDDFCVPSISFGIYDGIIAWDHATDECWIIATGFPENDCTTRKLIATQRIEEIYRWLNEEEKGEFPVEGSPAENLSSNEPTDPKQPPLDLSKYYRLSRDRIGEHFPNHSIEMKPGQQVLTGTELSQYLDSIKKAKDYLAKGDIFQVNLAQQLVVETSLSGPEVYHNLREENPAPFAAYFDLGESQVISASPERLFSLQSSGEVETRPIKGTCPRTGDATVDEEAGRQLQSSPKDCAENVMIVDLLRNDLSKVCSPDSISVQSLCRLEPYQFVQHLTSVVTGKLASGKTAKDVLLALFPGGSITGAPKVRAMEIIQELEPVARGPYCGSMGYLSFGSVDRPNNSDFNILIRTLTLKDGWCQVPVGGGIVLDSDPKGEFDETLVKAHGMLKALL